MNHSAVLFLQARQNPDGGWGYVPNQQSTAAPAAAAAPALRGKQGFSAAESQAGAWLRGAQHRDGGWNVGNPRMFSQPLPAHAHPTAWVLMALARVAPGRVLCEDLEALRAEMESDAGARAFAVGAMALRACGQDPADPLLRLHGLQQPDGSWDGNSFHTALAALALAGGGGL